METGAGAADTSESTAGGEGSGAEASGTCASDCGSIIEEIETGSGSRAGSTGPGRSGIGRSALKELVASPETVSGSSSRRGSSERRAVVGCGTSDSLIVVTSAIDPLSSIGIEGCANGNGSGSLNEIGGSEVGVDVMDGKEASGSGTGSG